MGLKNNNEKYKNYFSDKAQLRLKLGFFLVKKFRENFCT